MTDKHINLCNGEPRVSEHGMRVSTLVEEFVSESQSVEAFAEAHEMDKKQVIAVLQWAASHSDIVYRLRMAATRSGCADTDENGDAITRAGSKESVHDLRAALADVQREWHPYRDTRWSDE